MDYKELVDLGKRDVSRRQLLRGLGAGVLMVGGAKLLAACAPDGSAASTVAPSSIATTSAAGGSSIEGSTIQWTGWTLTEIPEVIQGFITDFEEEFGVTIETEGFPFGEYLNQVLLQAGQLTGAVQLDAEMLSSVAELGILRDLSDVAARADYTPAALEMGQVGGAQVGLPWTQASIGTIANRQILEDAGVSALPGTIAEFEAALEAIRSHDSSVIPYAAMTAVAQARDIVMWMRTFGSEVVDANGGFLLGDEGSVRAVQWYVDLLGDGLVAPGVARADAHTLFAQRKVGVYDDAMPAKGLVLANAENPDDLEAAMVPMRRPVAEGGNSENLFWGHLMAIVDDENAGPASEWSLHLTSDPEVVLDYFKAFSFAPTTQAGLDADVVKADEFVSTWSTELVPTARANPFLAYPEDRPGLEQILGEELEAALVGGKSAENAMADAAERMSELVS